MLRRALRLLLPLAALLACASCTGLDWLNAPVPTWGYQRTTDLPYGSDPRQKLDIYVPTHATANTPVVIFFYGGEWMMGDKHDFRFVAQGLTSRGFIAVIPNYRLYPQVTFPAFVQDGALAFRWTRQHITQFGGNSQRIYLMGHSAGAYIAAFLTLDNHYLADVGLDRECIRATACIAGPFNFYPYVEDLGIFNMHPGDLKPDPKIEPVNFVDGKEPPMLFIQGMKDGVIDARNSFEMADLIYHAGGNSRLIYYPDQGHITILMALAFEFRWFAPVLHDTVHFFREN